MLELRSIVISQRHLFFLSFPCLFSEMLLLTSFFKLTIIFLWLWLWMYHNREMNLLLVPYHADPELDLIQWPPFLLANKVGLLYCFIL